jgi:putative transposase
VSPIGTVYSKGNTMANTYTQIYIHTIFAVKFRQHLITNAHKDEIQKYMTGVVTNLGSKLIAINNMPDHFHLLIGVKPDKAFSELVGKVKSATSGFINKNRWVYGHFEWQEGFGGFSYSHSQLTSVIGYIQDQETHHTQRSFREEYEAFLVEFNIQFDEKYTFKELIDIP